MGGLGRGGGGGGVVKPLLDNVQKKDAFFVMASLTKRFSLALNKKFKAIQIFLKKILELDILFVAYLAH